MPRTFSDSLDTDLSEVFFNANEFAVLVAVRRGHRTTQNIPAIVVQRVYQVNDDDAKLQIQSMDFDITVAAYQIADEATEPRDGDQITMDGRVYQVLPLQMNGGDKSQSHELVGGNGDIWRIHTKRMR